MDPKLKEFDKVLRELKFNLDLSSISENSSGAPIAPRSVLPSEDRVELENLYTKIRKALKEKPYSVSFDQDRITIKPGSPDSEQVNPFDYTPYMKSIFESLQLNESLGVSQPQVELIEDLNECENLFGKTAYYAPDEEKIVLYTLGRHPKDVLRSYAHELIHHIQNKEGRLDSISTSDTNQSTYLQEIEEEAYLKGNILFRKWEDSQKSDTGK